MKENRYIRKNTRYYNNAFSFASFSAKTIRYSGKQIYNLKIQGTIYQNLPNTVECEDDNEKALGGQLYIYDTDTSINKRVPYYKQLNIDYLKYLHQFLKKTLIQKNINILKS